MSFVNNATMVISGENEDGQGNLVLGLVGAAVGAIGMGVVYGVVSAILFEHSITAILIGAASGFLAVKLGRGRSMVVGVAAAVLTLVGVMIGKVIIGSPEGVSFIAYHTTLFDILFCYLISPATALGMAGSDKIRALRSKLPF